MLDQIDQGFVWPIHGGIHPPQMKDIAPATFLKHLPLSSRFLVPIPQVNDSAVLTVGVGDKVSKGQSLTQGQGQLYLPVHAPTSGVVSAIEPRPSNHASGLPVLTCVIDSDGLDTSVNYQAANPAALSTDEILAKIQQAGIAGLGGAAFPSHIKLASVSKIELVIINGVECEPYITADDALMRHHSDDIMKGVAIIEQLLKPQRIVIAIEDNKPEAIAAMQQALASSTLPSPLARVTVVPTLYPSGGEKQLVQLLTGKEIPSGAIPAQLGMLIHNVGTCFAIHQAVSEGKPLIERVVTVTGQQASEPANYWVPIGMSVHDILQQLNFRPQAEQMVIIGGPMMGYTLPVTQVPVLKGTNCILLPAQQEMMAPVEQACIRCGECAVACPAMLLPQQLYWHSKAEEYDKASSFNLRDCIECGCCSYVCPSDIPLVEYFRIAKSALKKVAHEKEQAERAKQRFEARDKRLAAEKEARELKAKAASAKRQQTMSSNEKDAIAEAMARVKAKQAQKAQAAEPLAKIVALTNDDTKLVPSPNARVNVSTSSNTSEPASTSNADKVSAAIARAKAKKAALAAASSVNGAVLVESNHQNKAQAAASNLQNDADNHVVTQAESKADKVAAAIARAKAKKAAMANSTANESDTLRQAKSLATSPTELAANKTVDAGVDANSEAVTNTVSSADNSVDTKAAKIAAAVARAKAKKAAFAAEQDSSNEQLNMAPAPELASSASNAIANAHLEDSLANDKAAKVAAAVARAKAKKAAKAAELAGANATGTGTGTGTGANNTQSIENQAIETQAAEIQLVEHQTVENQASLTEVAKTEATEAKPVDARDDKAARVAAAVAKAKAKALAKKQHSVDENKD